METLLFSKSLVYLLVQTISNGSGCWLINDTQHIETRNGASILGGLALGVIEVGWYCDHSIVHSLWMGKEIAISLA